MSTPAAHVAGAGCGDHDMDGSSVDVAGGALLDPSDGVDPKRSERSVVGWLWATAARAVRTEASAM